MYPSTKTALLWASSNLGYTSLNASCDSWKPELLQSPLFVSIDLEFNDKYIKQLGISTLDPESLQSPDTKYQISNDYPIKSTWHAKCIKIWKALNNSNSRPFHYGTRQTLPDDGTWPLLEQALTVPNQQGILRDVIIVGHSIHSDIAVIEKFCERDIRQLPTVKAVLDTQQLCRSILSASKPMSLKQLLKTLDLKFVGLHNAAHDSRHALRALLSLVCKYERSCMGPLSFEMSERLGLLEEIAQYHQLRRVTWCYDSKRVKFVGNPDLLDREMDEGDFLLDILEQQG